ncbi:MAG: GNAT family N-acetyltransferase [Anaerolineae bacterium]|nr:GNAT family N-acetyltransferase [Anaerolineae bacterium]
MTLHSLDDVPRAALVEAINHAYADYYVPIQLSQAGFAELVEHESVQPEASVVARSGSEIVGMGLLGIRGIRAWIGGMGVIPAWRGQGVGRQIMDALIHHARRLSIRRIQLEVIRENLIAYNLYQSLGFRAHRQLLVLNRDRNAPYEPPDGAAGVRISVIAPESAINALEALPAPERPWQRDLATMPLLLREINGLAARAPAGQIRGICLYGGDIYGAGLLDLASVDADTARCLIARLLDELRAAPMVFINVAEDDPVLPLLLEYGFYESLCQIEMVLELTPGS